MIFSSLLFIYGFLPVSILLCYITPKKHRNMTLLFLSTIFCGLIGLRYLGFILIFALWNYFMVKAVEKLRKHRALAAFPLALGIIGDIATMLVFKTRYFDDITENIGLAEGFFPIGISFLTLSAIGSLIDVYSGKIRKSVSPLTYLLYILFFPKLIMGPLVSYQSFAKMAEKRCSTLNCIGAGISLFMRGLAKRVILAQSLYTLYNSVKAIEISELSALTAWLGMMAYMLCLYFTLSGYSDMGAGIAACYGFRFPRSFNYPVFSKGINGFCRKWHKPMVSWFGRYIYRPISGAVSKKWLKYSAFVLMWVFIGLWYRFSVNTLIWGGIIGVSAVIEQIAANKNTMRSTAVIYTFLITALAAVFFARDSLSESFMYFLAMIGGNNNLVDQTGLYLLRSYAVILLVCMLSSTAVFRNLTARSPNKLVRHLIGIIYSIEAIFLLMLCTVFISYSGTAEMILIQL